MNRISSLPALACAVAMASALAGCGGSDVGAPVAPQPVASSARSAPVAAVAPVAFVVGVGDGPGVERFVVKMSDPAAIATARQALSGGLKGQPVLVGELREGGGGYNLDPTTGRAWSWHLEPSTVSFADSTIEVTDGRPSDIEGNLSYWMRLGRYTPWSNRIEREVLKPAAKSKSK